MKTVKFRTGEIGDYTVCLPLFIKLYHGDIGSNFKQTFENYVKEGVVLLAENSNRVIGILAGSYHLDIDWEGKIAKLDAIIVDKAYRKKGIGRKLIRHFIALARKTRCKGIKSRLNVENIDAQKFHESQGFTKAKTYEYFLDFQARDR
ncbi:MAG: GNAT family N-acetyltransferase [Candidatus Bathyarchaeota archaeon]|nr:GNAT family N-acetyltransferase [Candidatus Bathyarchaeota archaeon]